ncbi:MAG: hypothetical protein QM689_11490 [Oscillospiraceae bacterium]
MYRQDSGAVTADGVRVYENPALKRNLFLMTEEVAYFPQWTLAAMRRFFKGFYPTWNDKTYYGLVDFFRIPEKKKIQRFSKGMQRQAGLIAAFSANVKYLLLDEAFDGLDVTSREAVRELLGFYVREKHGTAVVTSHNLAELESFCDRVGMLDNGRLVLDADPAAMKQTRCKITLPAQVDVSGFRLIGAADNRFSYLADCDAEEAIRRLGEAGCGAAIEPAGLEDFFRSERAVGTVDWAEIF